jgi:hypothetical protein
MANHPRLYLVYAVVVCLLTGMTVYRLATVYTTYSGTFDESFHIAAGMEWLDKGVYTYEWQHPPLARIAVAIGPYLAGLRSHSIKIAPLEGNAILETNHVYQHNLMLARLGNLPFLMLACVVISLWASRWFTPTTGILALLLFLSLPPILAHAALATLDIACAATILLALYCLMRWLENPSWLHSMSLGVAVAIALLSKFSSIPFLGLCFVVMLVYYRTSLRDWHQAKGKLRLKQICVMAVIAFTILWAGYRFSVAPVSDKPTHPAFDKHFAPDSEARKIGDEILGLRLPLTQFFKGIWDVKYHNSTGHDSYLLGEYRTTGWWYFFPVVLAVKTPIGFLILTLIGFGFIFRRPGPSAWQQRVTASLPLVILLFCMTSRIDIGLRHILAVFPMFALIAGYAVERSFAYRRFYIMPAISALLVCSVVIDSWMAHPDYLPWFNQLAGRHPEHIVVDSDLDWGQDLQRLGWRMKELGVKQVSIAYLGTAPMESAGLPSYQALDPVKKTTGYIAISMRCITLENAKDGSFAWLKQYTPTEKIGKSILLYHLPAQDGLQNLSVPTTQTVPPELTYWDLLSHPCGIAQ